MDTSLTQDLRHRLHSAVHVLNGDMLLGQLHSITPELECIVFRECLIEGQVCNGTTEQLLALRSTELQRLYDVEPLEYQRKTGAEIERVRSIASGREVMLWFENDAFCQCNLWFLSTLFDASSTTLLSRVFPSPERSGWSTFDIHDESRLLELVESSVQLRKDDLLLLQALWQAYGSSSFTELQHLSQTTSPVIQHLPDVVDLLEFRFASSIDQSTLAQRARTLEHFNEENFSKAFWEFSKKFPQYGLGDLQFKHVFELLKN